MAAIGGKIEREVTGWPGVKAKSHRFAGVGFRVNGHLHGDCLADLPLPVRVRRELVAAGGARLHHVLPQTGWVSYSIRQPVDVEGALELFRLNLQRLRARNKEGA